MTIDNVTGSSRTVNSDMDPVSVGRLRKTGRMASSELELPAGYPALLQELKERVHAARQHAQRQVNTQLIELYWSIGHAILAQQKREGWGSGVIDRLASDLRLAFPDMTGLSRSNLQYMRGFAAAWSPELAISQQAVFGTPRD